MPLERVAVVGAGAWGTALAQAAAMAGRDVLLLGRDPAAVAEINRDHTNTAHLGRQRLSERIAAATEFDRAAELDILAVAAPAAIPYVLSGPSFAADVAAGRPTAVTLAGDEPEATDAIAAALAGPSFRRYAAGDR